MRSRTLVAGAVVGAALSVVLASGSASADVTSLLLTPNTVNPGGTVSVSAEINDAEGTGQREVTLQVPPGTDATFVVPSPQPTWADRPCLLITPQLLSCLWTPVAPGSSILFRADLTIGSSASAGTITVTATSPGEDQVAPLLVTLTPTQTTDPTPTPTVPATPTQVPGGQGSGEGGAGGEGGIDGEAGGETIPVPTAVPAGQQPADNGGSGALAVVLVAVAALGGAVAFRSIRRTGRHSV